VFFCVLVSLRVHFPVEITFTKTNYIPSDKTISKEQLMSYPGTKSGKTKQFLGDHLDNMLYEKTGNNDGTCLELILGNFVMSVATLEL